MIFESGTKEVVSADSRLELKGPDSMDIISYNVVKFNKPGHYRVDFDGDKICVIKVSGNTKAFTKGERKNGGQDKAHEQE